MTTTTKASDLFIRSLENEGVKHIFAVPGEENLDLLDSLRDSSIELVLTRHEQSAAFMAATYGRLTGRTGVCMATLGPGATNLVTGAAYAKLGAMPMLMITGQKPIKASKQGQFQIVDVVSMMQPLCKMTKQIVNGQTIPALVREAVRRAEEERPGPVHLELPEDIAIEQVDDGRVMPRTSPRRPDADHKAIATAAEKIIAAKRPLLLIGAGANRKRISAALQAFIDRTGIYCLTSQMGKGVIDERQQRHLGTTALSDGDYVHCAVDRADLVVNVGHDVIEKPPFFMEHGGKEVIHINFFSAEVDQVYFPQLELVGDIATTIDKLGKAVGDRRCQDDGFFARVQIEVDKHLAEGADDDRCPMTPQRIIADIRTVMDDEDIIALDNGMYKIWFARNYPAHRPNTVLLDNALATMGAGLPSAMLAAIHHPDKQVLAIAGDGGFMMNSQELETAVRLGLNLAIIVLRDNAYGMIRWKQAVAKLPDYGLEYGNPDFVQYAESYGAKGHRIGAAADLVPTLRGAYADGGVHLIEVPIDYSENTRVLIDELAERVCVL